MSRRTTAIILVLTRLLLGGLTTANAQEKDTFGGWEHLDVSIPFGTSNWTASLYLEHDNLEYRRMSLFYASAGVGYKFTDWLRAGINYDFLVEPEAIAHRAVAHVTGTLKEGNLTVSLRERYQYIWSGGVTRANELRSKLKAQYAIPGSRFSPYVAVEVYTWDKWLKTRHYVGTTIDITQKIAFEAYYMYFVFSNQPAWHIIGLGLNINL